MVLDTYQAVETFYPKARSLRLRVEHAQVLNLTDLPRFAELEVLPMMQPTHCTSDMSWAPDRLGPDRIKYAYAWQSLLNSSIRVPFGSDFPVEQVNPMLGLYAAVTREDTSGNPVGGFYPEQRVSRHDALRGFTYDGAYAARQEGVTGSLAVGKRADFVIIDKDIMNEEIDSSIFLSAQVLGTIVGGICRYQGPEKLTGLC